MVKRDWRLAASAPRVVRLQLVSLAALAAQSENFRASGTPIA
jgi:hypothetical protein